MPNEEINKLADTLKENVIALAMKKAELKKYFNEESEEYKLPYDKWDEQRSNIRYDIEVLEDNIDYIRDKIEALCE